MRYSQLQAGLAGGAVVLMDGATGTQLQRRGASMNATAWSGAAGAANTEMLEQIHRDYIASGARLITANTFATSRLVLAAAGLGAQYAQINAVTLEAGRRAAAAGAVLGGSLSHMVPRHNGHGEPDPAAVAESLAEHAETLVAGGCEVILLEMMFAPERMEAAFSAASATGLPVWAGFSARRGANGTVLSFAQDRDIHFVEIAAILDDFDVDAAGVMHSEAEVTGDALALIRDRFSGPLTAYPDSGHMKMPEWQFQDVIAPADLAAFAAGWVANGAQVLGGCCGLDATHLKALSPLTHGPGVE